MNFAEILRARGVPVAYKYEWQEGVTQHVYEMLVAGSKPAASIAQELLGTGLTREQVMWVMRDASDRKTIQTALEHQNNNFLL